MKDIKLFSEMRAFFLVKKISPEFCVLTEFPVRYQYFRPIFNLLSVDEGECIHRTGTGAKAAADAEFRVEDQFIITFQSVHSASFHAEPAADTGIGIMACDVVGKWPGSDQV